MDGHVSHGNYILVYIDILWFVFCVTRFGIVVLRFPMYGYVSLEKYMCNEGTVCVFGVGCWYKYRGVLFF